LACNQRVRIDSERDNSGVLGCSDGHVVVAGHECALGVPDRLIADLDGPVEDVQVCVAARLRRKRGRGPSEEVAVVEADLVANL